MKKVLAVVALVAAVACFTSCKKTCTCVTTQNGVTVQTVEQQATKCSDLNITQTVAGFTQETKCN